MRYLQNNKNDKIRLYTLIFLVLISIAAVIARIKLFPFLSKDMGNFLLPWFNKMKDNGGFFALSEPIGDYMPPYYYFMAFLTYLPFDPNKSIKFISCIFDFITAVYCGKIILYTTKDIKKSAVVYAMALFLPTVIINSGVWGQCDGIYTSFVVMSVYYMITKKETAAYILYGVALSFKLQAIFVLPFFIIMLLKGFISYKKLWLIPVAFFVMMIPAVLFGDNIIRIIGVYLNQSTEYSELSLSVANFWAFIKDVGYPEIPRAAIFFAGSVVLTFMYYMLMKQCRLTPSAVIVGIAFFTVLMPFILPHMHERYYYMGVIFTLLAVVPNKKNIWILLIIEMVSSLSMSAFVFDNKIDSWALLSFAAAVGIYGLFRLYDSLTYTETEYKQEEEV